MHIHGRREKTNNPHPALTRRPPPFRGRCIAPVAAAAPSPARLFLMRLGELTHAGELEIVLRHGAGVHRRTEALVLMAAIDPTGGKADVVRRLVIVKHALGGMQNIALLDARYLQVA